MSYLPKTGPIGPFVENPQKMGLFRGPILDQTHGNWAANRSTNPLGKVELRPYWPDSVTIDQGWRQLRQRPAPRRLQETIPLIPTQLQLGGLGGIANANQVR